MRRTKERPKQKENKNLNVLLPPKPGKLEITEALAELDLPKRFSALTDGNQLGSQEERQCLYCQNESKQSRRLTLKVVVWNGIKVSKSKKKKIRIRV